MHGTVVKRYRTCMPEVNMVLVSFSYFSFAIYMQLPTSTIHDECVIIILILNGNNCGNTKLPYDITKRGL